MMDALLNRRFRRVVDVVDSFIWWYIPWYRGPMPNDIYPEWRRLRHPNGLHAKGCHSAR